MLSRTLRKYKSWHIMSMTMLAGLVITVLCGAVVYVIEGPMTASPINTYFDSFYWAIGTVTRVGYGDMVPITVTGKIASVILALTGFVCTAVFMGWVVAKTALR